MTQSRCEDTKLTGGKFKLLSLIYELSRFTGFAPYTRDRLELVSFTGGISPVFLLDARTSEIDLNGTAQVDHQMEPCWYCWIIEMNTINDFNTVFTISLDLHKAHVSHSRSKEAIKCISKHYNITLEVQRWYQYKIHHPSVWKGQK